MLLNGFRAFKLTYPEGIRLLRFTCSEVVAEETSCSNSQRPDEEGVAVPSGVAVALLLALPLRRTPHQPPAGAPFAVGVRPLWLRLGLLLRAPLHRPLLGRVTSPLLAGARVTIRLLPLGVGPVTRSSDAPLLGRSVALRVRLALLLVVLRLLIAGGHP